VGARVLSPKRSSWWMPSECFSRSCNFKRDADPLSNAEPPSPRQTCRPPSRLSQTPIRILLAVRYLHSDLSTLELVPSPAPLVRSASFPSTRLYRAKECARESISPSTLSAALAPHANQQPHSPFSPPLSDVLTPGATTDSSESSSGFFTAQSRSLSRHSLLGDTSIGLPSIGSFGFHREGYVEAVVDELETCVERRSLVRLKLAAGTQQFMPPEGEKELKMAMGQRWGVEEIEKWKVCSFRAFRAFLRRRRTAELGCGALSYTSTDHPSSSFFPTNRSTAPRRRLALSFPSPSPQNEQRNFAESLSTNWASSCRMVLRMFMYSTWIVGGQCLEWPLQS
jgi:hypothetical protein